MFTISGILYFSDKEVLDGRRKKHWVIPLWNVEKIQHGRFQNSVSPKKKLTAQDVLWLPTCSVLQSYGMQRYGSLPKVSLMKSNQNRRKTWNRKETQFPRIIDGRREPIVGPRNIKWLSKKLKIQCLVSYPYVTPTTMVSLVTMLKWLPTKGLNWWFLLYKLKQSWFPPYARKANIGSNLSLGLYLLILLTSSSIAPLQ